MILVTCKKENMAGNNTGDKGATFYFSIPVTVEKHVAQT
jgi:hypothetical protein